MDKIRDVWTGDLDTLLDTLLRLTTTNDSSQEQELQQNKKDHQDEEQEQNTPQAEVKNEEEDTDKPINPTDNGQTEDSHGGNESTAQTDSTTNMEEDGDNGTQGGQDSAGDETEYEDQDYADDDSADDDSVGEINAEGFEAMDSDAEKLRQAKYVAKYFKLLLENLGSEVVFEVPGTDRLDMRAVIKRAVTKAPLWHCYKDEIKNQVLVLIDNSGSMDHSYLLMEVAYETASRMQNVQAFYMPNGQFDYTTSDKEKQQIEQAMAATQVVLYIGDFDGADLPIELAYAGKEVLWVCPEMARYEHIEDHDWVSYTQADLAKLQAGQRLWIYWVDGVKPIDQEYVQAFKDAMLRRRTKRVATFSDDI